MTLILDASMALSWLLKRKDSSEAALSQEALDFLRASGAMVPVLWYSEVANALLLAERLGAIAAHESAVFLSSLSIWQIVQDSAPPAMCQAQVMHLGRVYKLTAYDATYLELALRMGVSLATFDRKLAEATRKAGGQVFGDPT